MPRYLITFVRDDGSGEFETTDTRYVDAPDPDAAVRKGDVLRTQRRVLNVREVADNEGRGVLWRLWRWMRR